MSFNPFDEEYELLKNDIREKESTLLKARKEIIWYDTFNMQNAEQQLSKTNHAIISLDEMIIEKKNRINSLNMELISLNSKIKSKYNLLSYFNTKQKKLRSKRDRLTTQSKEGKSGLSKYQKQRNSFIADKKQLESALKHHHEFDKVLTCDIETELSEEIQVLDSKFSKISRKKDDVDLALKPIMDEINYYSKEIELENDTVKKAKQFESELDRADSGYERSLIHEECENTFGEGSPRTIIRRGERRFNQLTRDKEKTEKRAAHIGKKFARVIEKIIIDGNNMCYSGNSLVGINPLIQTVDELSEKYELVVVFDASINHILKVSETHLESVFNEIVCHIVQRGKQADEIITNLANTNQNYYILSNDRFGDYRDKESVRSGRIIHHEILDNRILITDLGLNIAYS